LGAWKLCSSPATFIENTEIAEAIRQIQSDDHFLQFLNIVCGSGGKFFHCRLLYLLRLKARR
jgi:hypothetical protein